MCTNTTARAHGWVVFGDGGGVVIHADTDVRASDRRVCACVRARIVVDINHQPSRSCETTDPGIVRRNRCRHRRRRRRA